MKRIIFAIHLLSILLCLIVGCKSDIQHSSAIPEPKTTFTVQGVQFTMVHVEGGSFTMGATSEQIWYSVIDEKPAHQVTLSSFSIGETEVTQALWKAVMGIDPPKVALWENVMETGKGPQHPVVWVSWDDCQEFLKKLNALTGKDFRLPTEAEWEYAARGGNKSKGYMYAGSNTLEEVAWYEKNCPYKDDDQSDYCPHEVALKHPNELGLYDMSGNVEEWCSDWYKYDYYSVSPKMNPQGPDSGFNYVARGGYWRENDRHCRVSYRHYHDEGSGDVGFRLVLSE